MCADYYSLPSDKSVNATCREAIMTHFQGWKKEFTAFTTSQPPADAHVTVVTQTGFIYLRLSTARELPRLHGLGIRIKTYGETLKHRIWSGRVIPDDIHEMSKASVGPAGYYIPRLLGKRLMALAGDPEIVHLVDKKQAIEANKISELRTDYCITFSENFAGCSCNLLGSQITVLRSDPSVILKEDITLITVGWADEIASGGADQLLSSFGTAKMNKVVVFSFCRSIYD